jgi:hypothetical protein
MANIAFFEVPVELRLKLCAIVGLHDEDAKWQPPKHVVDELDGCPLRARIKQPQHTNEREVRPPAAPTTGPRDDRGYVPPRRLSLFMTARGAMQCDERFSV